MAMPSDLRDWTQLLLRYYFARSHGGDTPVTSLSVTSWDFALAADEPVAKGESLRDAFVEALLIECSRKPNPDHRCVLHCAGDNDCFNYENSLPKEPYFFGHLLFSVLAAATPPEDVTDDKGYWASFNSLLSRHDGVRPPIENRKELLPSVWVKFRDWLAAHASTHRPLSLPNPGTFKRCGYSLKLAFPLQRDAARLVELLKETADGPLVPERVVDVLRHSRAKFSPSFVTHFDAFAAYLDSPGASAHRDPFWSTVLAAGDRLDDDFGTLLQSGPPFQLAAVEEDLFQIRIAVPREHADTSLDLEELDGDPDWAGFLKQGDETPLDAPLRTMDDRLAVRHRQAVQFGFVPFVERDGFPGLWQVARGEDLVASPVRAFVHRRLVDLVVSTFGTRVESLRFAEDGDWVLTGPFLFDLTRDLPNGLQGLKAFLHSTATPRPRLKGGLRIGRSDTFLRLKGHLPVVSAPGATTMMLCGSGDLPEMPLQQGGDGHWLLPDELLQSDDSDTNHRVQASYATATPSSARFTLVSDPGFPDYPGLSTGHFAVETMSRRFQLLEFPRCDVPSFGLVDNPNLALDLLSMDPSARWLGPRIGEMSRGPGFPWLAIGPRCNPRFVVLTLDAPPPGGGGLSQEDGVSPSSGDRRHWRSAFAALPADAPTRYWAFRDGTYRRWRDWTDEERTYLEAFRRLARAKDGCRPRTVAETNLPSCHDDDGTQEIQEKPELDTLLRVLAAMARKHNGIQLNVLHDHVATQLRLDPKGQQVWDLIQAYVECAMFDLIHCGYDCRSRRLFARRPRFVMFRRGPEWSARLLGLVTSRMRRHIVSVATSRFPDLRISWASADTSLVPPVLQIVSDSRETFRELAAHFDLPPPSYLDWQDTTEIPEWLISNDTIEQGKPYDGFKQVASWSWIEGGFRSRAAAAAHLPQDPGSPEVGLEIRSLSASKRYVLTLGAQDVASSRFRNWALISAHELKGLPFVVMTGEGELAMSARAPFYLPLPFGRLCSIAGRRLPGPPDPAKGAAATYSYPYGRRMEALVRRALPPGWLATGVD